MTKPILNHSESSSVTKGSQESNRKGREIDRESTLQVSGQESAIFAIIRYHSWKNTGCKMKYCKQLTKRSDMAKSGNLESGRKKSCTYHRSNGHSGEDCYQQKPEAKSGNFDDGRTRRCNFHSGGSR